MSEVRKIVTIIFCDVIGSTRLGEEHDPEALRSVMSRYFESMRVVIERHGGTVEKFIGDAVMAVFGVPQVHEDDAIRAVRAAAEMQEALAALSTELEAESGITIEARIGVNTGEVVAGDAETRQQMVTGDAVNVAARLEQTAQPGEVLLGDATYQLACNFVRASRLEPLSLKGKRDPLPAWKLTELLPDASVLARVPAGPFVGRSDELTLLQLAFESAVLDRECRLATIVGPPGIGKSRLASEFTSSISTRSRVVMGRCLPYGDGITYWPLAEILRQVFGDEPDQGLAEVVAGREYSPLVIARIKGAVGAPAGVGAGSPEETAWAFRMLFEVLAGPAPLVIVVDDIHWADPILLDLLEYLVAFSSGFPILILCTARPDVYDARPSWAAPRASSTVVSLNPLTDREAASLVDRLAQDDQLNDRLRSRIVEAAEGNPLFVEQMLAMQSDDPRHELSVPPTIQALLAARIDLLSSDERSVLQCASVEGRVFHRGAVAALLPDHIRPGLGAQLMSLIRKEFLRPGRSLFPGDDGFRFNHMLIRDAAYEATPKQIRADMHERYADWLEQRIDEDVVEREEILGYHLSRAHDYRGELGLPGDGGATLAKRAAAHLEVAGRQAANRLSPAAITLLEQAASLLPLNDPTRGRILVELAESLYDLGEMERADLALGEAIEVCTSGGDIALAQHARLRRASQRFNTGIEPPSPEELLAEAGRSIDVSEQHQDDRALAYAFRVMGGAYWALGRMEAALEVSERALQHAQRVGEAKLVDDCTSYVFQTIMLGPTPLSEVLTRAEGLCQILSAYRIFAWDCEIYRAWALSLLGRFGDARAALAKVEDLVKNFESTRETAGVSWIIGIVAWCEGDQLAEAKLREAFDSWDRRGEKRNAATTATELARVLYDQARYDEVQALTERAQEMLIMDDLEVQIPLLGLQARLLARRGAFEDADALVEDARRMAEATDFLNLQGDAAMDAAEVARLAGNTEESTAAASDALTCYERKGSVVPANRARIFIGTLTVLGSHDCELRS